MRFCWPRCCFAAPRLPARPRRPYTGSGKGNNGEIQGALTVEDGAITACEVVSHSETLGICDAALEQIPAAVISAQSAEVDTVTGATNTSHGILEAVADAM